MTSTILVAASCVLAAVIIAFSAWTVATLPARRGGGYRANRSVNPRTVRCPGGVRVRPLQHPVLPSFRAPQPGVEPPPIGVESTLGHGTDCICRICERNGGDKRLWGFVHRSRQTEVRCG